MTASNEKQLEYCAIGVIRSPFREPEGTPIQPVFASDAPGTVEIFPEFAAGLKDLAGFERIWLIYYLHQSSVVRLNATPFLDTRPHGIFAIRSPARPNPIGLSCVRLLHIEGNVISIAGVDMIDGTPLLDIKPYVPKFDAFPESRAGWFDEVSGGVTKADRRFVSPDKRR